jgi:hypothetical protein
MISYKIKRREKNMPEEGRNCGCNNNGGFLNGLFGGCGCDSEILFFIIIFLLLFTNFGCGCQR